MPCIAISRLSFTSGKAIADKVASQLGYECVDREVFQDAAANSGLTEEKAARALQEPPSFFGMSAASRKRAIAHVSAALARRFRAGDVVYRGPFGHLLIPGISHVLKVRIFATREDRIEAKLEREPAVSAEEAERAIVKDDKYRLKLARLVFNADDDDPNLFDLVVNTSQVDVDTAVDIIAGTAKLKRYQPMTYSLRAMEDCELSLRARASLIDLDPDVSAQAENGRLRLRSRIRSADRAGKRQLAEMRQRASALEGVEDVEMESA